MSFRFADLKKRFARSCQEREDLAKKDKKIEDKYSLLHAELGKMIDNYYTVHGTSLSSMESNPQRQTNAKFR